MTDFFEAKKILPFSFWRRLKFFSFGGLNPILRRFIIIFIFGARISLFVWELAIFCFRIVDNLYICSFVAFFWHTLC